jgi:hypothetical protein
MKKFFVVVSAISIFAVILPQASAKDKKKDDNEGTVVMTWPDSANPALRLTFGKFTQMASYNGQTSLGTAVLVQNVSGKPIPQASFTVYLLDKDHVRIGNGILDLSDLEPGQQVRLPFQVFAVGTPATLSLVAHKSADGMPNSLRRIPIKVVSVPPGAALKVDGQDAGTTPKMVELTVGSHKLEFSKADYATGSTTVEIQPDEIPGGSISFELGGLSHDTIELRDGSVVQGDAISMNLTSLVLRVDGKDQPSDRNQIRRIVLVERETTNQPAVVQPAPVPTPAQK